MEQSRVTEWTGPAIIHFAPVKPVRWRIKTLLHPLFSNSKPTSAAGTWPPREGCGGHVPARVWHPLGGTGRHSGNRRLHVPPSSMAESTACQGHGLVKKSSFRGWWATDRIDWNIVLVCSSIRLPWLPKRFCLSFRRGIEPRSTRWNPEDEPFQSDTALTSWTHGKRCQILKYRSKLYPGIRVDPLKIGASLNSISNIVNKIVRKKSAPRWPRCKIGRLFPPKNDIVDIGKKIITGR